MRILDPVARHSDHKRGVALVGIGDHLEHMLRDLVRSIGVEGVALSAAHTPQILARIFNDRRLLRIDENRGEVAGRGSGLSSLLSIPERNHVRRALVHDSIDQRRQPLERAGLFVVVGVSVVSALDASDGVTHDALSMFARNAGPAHEAAGAATKIMHRPIPHAAQLIESRLRL